MHSPKKVSRRYNANYSPPRAGFFMPGTCRAIFLLTLVTPLFILCDIDNTVTLMISTTPCRPSTPKTLGELRRLIAGKPDDTPLLAEGFDGEFRPPAFYLETGETPTTIYFIETT